MAETKHTKVLIIGSGAAGYTAAIYAARAMLNPILVAGMQPGGQLTVSSEVENFPGFPEKMTGTEIMDRMRQQTENVGATLINDIITKIDLSKRPFTAIGDSGTTYTAEAVIIATGASARWLGLPSEEQFKGKGVSACATCDGFFYRNKEVMVVGGGNTAMEEALFLTQFANKVIILHRGDKFRGEAVMMERIKKEKKIEVIWNAELQEVLGDDAGVTGAKVKNNQTGQETDVPVHGVFIAIGHAPNTKLFEGQLALDHGYITTKPNSTATEIPGVYAAGDVQDHIFRQAVTAAGTGCMAALEVRKFLEEN